MKKSLVVFAVFAAAIAVAQQESGAHKAWDKTKEGAHKAWDSTKAGTHRAWDSTKAGSERAWDKTKGEFHKEGNGSK